MLNTSEDIQEKLKDNIDSLFSDSLEEACPLGFVELDLENITHQVKFDRKKFTEGVNSVAELCGQITALVNAGITPRDALDYLATKESTILLAQNNLDIAKIKT